MKIKCRQVKMTVKHELLWWLGYKVKNLECRHVYSLRADVSYFLGNRGSARRLACLHESE